MLTNLRLQNFKGWPDTGNLPLKPITALFGPNGSGKTALIQAILLIKQTAAAQNPAQALDFGSPDTPTELGDYQNIAHRRHPRRPLKISLDWQPPKPFTITQREKTIIETQQIGFDLTLREDHQSPPQPAVAQMTYRAGPAELGMKSIPGGNQYTLHFNHPQTAGLPTEPAPSAAFPPPPNCHRFPAQAHAHLAQAGITADFEPALEKLLTGIHYQASRKPASETTPDPAKPNPGLQQYIARWLKQIGLIQNLRIIPNPQNQELSEIRVIQHQNGTEIPLADAGSGASRILPLLTLCHRVPPGSTIILNQPETHLHPSIQSALADIIIEAHQTRQIQTLLETHSEPILYRLQRRLAEQKITGDEISLFYCQTKDADCHIEPLHLDEYGNIKNWPKNFFGNPFGEISATADAIMKRRIKAK